MRQFSRWEAYMLAWISDTGNIMNNEVLKHWRSVDI